MKYLFTGILLLSSMISCKKSDSTIWITEINIETAIGNMEVVKLSQFADDLEYVAIETCDESIVSDYNHFAIDEKNIIITNPEMSMLLFERSGKYITEFGKKGLGPEEYQAVKDLSLIEEEAYFSSGKDVFVFSISGALQNKYPGILNPQDGIHLDNITLVDDSLIFGHIPNNNGQAPFKGMLINKNGKVKTAYTNFDILESKGSRINGGSTQVYSFEKSVHFKEQFTDTLYFIDSRYNLIPKFSFIMGSLKMPESVRANFRGYFQKINDYYAVENILESPGYLFIDINFGSHFPVKQVTTKSNNEQEQEERRTITTHCLGIYNKKTTELVFCKPSGTDNPLSVSGLYNDLDAGPRFFPERMINDTTMLMVISARDLINHVNSEEFINSKSGYPEKKEQLRNFTCRLSEDSNPVLMILELK